ncbi:hypothetical protein GWK47_044992 [Chionoecetes opilio]|uniref:HAT C-terminal dimerisation domain-containing protein n=1 Tax=Chionoecetes opilio TaxID=41210 RepID=A0A8J4Y7S2_CHIOP|nr:hypothetical protein GWK47_044992 [Chionoecetes opilio]
MEQIRREAYITNEIIVEQELRRAREGAGHPPYTPPPTTRLRRGASWGGPGGAKGSVEEWVPSKGELAWSLFPYQHREVWVDLFIKYNTPLPSSAAVERLFSTAGDVLRAKRSSLEEVNFEELVFLKGNMDLLEEKMGQEDVEEEEEDL